MCIDNHLKHLAFQVLSQLSDNPQIALAVLNEAIAIIRHEYNLEDGPSPSCEASEPDRGVVVQFPRRDKSNPA